MKTLRVRTGTLDGGDRRHVCAWTGRLYEEHGEGLFDRNTESAHAYFDAHAQHFSPGVQNLLSAHALMERFGLKLLPFKSPAERRADDIISHTVKPTPEQTSTSTRAVAPRRSFEIALSFAGTERQYAKELAQMVRAAGVEVFYDDFYPEMLWGKDLVVFFDEIYRKRSRFCVMFISKEYAERMWTNHERRSAQARALDEKGKEYILPIKIDDTDLPGMPPMVGHLSIELGVERIAELLIKKLKGRTAD